MVIYCAHKFGGDIKNKKAAKKKIAAIQRNNMHHTFISPIQTFGWMYNSMDYDDGIRLCLDLLERCDELFVMSEPSKGVSIEIHHARKLNMPVRYAKGLVHLYKEIDPCI